jgi:hypothetical protein
MERDDKSLVSFHISETNENVNYMSQLLGNQLSYDNIDKMTK